VSFADYLRASRECGVHGARENNWAHLDLTLLRIANSDNMAP
jgi:hypothetical protein